MKIKSTWAFITVLFFLFASCKEIIQPSLTKKTVTPFAPGNRYQSTSYTINFWWDKLEDVNRYRLQVVTPSFDAIGALVIDTLVKGDKFALTVPPGQYEWRVRAENESSESAYSDPLRFFVAASSLKQQKASLVGPANNLLTSQGSVTFSWDYMYGATKYRLQIDTNSFGDETQVILDGVSPAKQQTFQFLKDKQYQWRVRAENDTARSLWSEIRYITYDHTPPGQVKQTSPSNEQTLALPITLQWQSVPTAVRYKVYVLRSDMATPFSNNFPAFTTNTTFSFTGGTSGDKLYWKVSAIDAAGNDGDASALRSFTIR